MLWKTLRRRSTLWVALFFAALTLVGLLTSADYGQPWDEPWEQDILRMNLNQYAQALGASARFAPQSDIAAPESGLIADSDERDHGESAYYPLFWLMNADINAQTRMTLWHGWTWLLFMGGAGALWLLCRRLGLSRLMSSAAVLCLLLTPRMFAEGHYNNKDVVLLSLTLATLWSAARLADRPTFPRALVFALAGALATNTKIVGLAIWGLCALMVLVRQIAAKRLTKRVWAIAAVTLAAFAGLYALLTPALWSDPLGFARYSLTNASGFTRWENDVLYNGYVYRLQSEALPRTYLPMMILLTTPPWVLLLFALGQVCALWRIVKSGAKAWADPISLTLLTCTLLWLVPLAYAVLARVTVYNGWRHFYFLYAPMLVLAGYGLRRCAEELRRFATLRRVCAAALSLCFVVSGALLGLAHPNEYVYYSLLASGRSLETTYELDYWNVSVLQTLRAWLSSPDRDQSVPLTIAGADLWAQTGLRYNLPLLSEEEQAQITLLDTGDENASYVLSNRTYAVIGGWTADASLEPLVQTRAFDSVLSEIYVCKEVQP